ncbi:MAG TPA: hypothetical protein VGR07_13260 [Thermoanaerobaculia bacterium]|jgi:hypothetical protein|nr:hypothetical protein [Thermoanaerobaculia bacterium]
MDRESKETTTVAGTAAKRRRTTLVQRLKPERVQEGLAARKVRQRLKSERVVERLKGMPGWQLARGGRAIDRVREFREPASAAAYAAFAAQLAAGRRQSLDITLSPARWS